MITIRNINENGITLATTNRSFASLDKWDYDLLTDLFENPSNLPVFWFTRIAVLEYHRNKGEGTLLLKEMRKIQDENNFIILLGINAYGDLNTEQLRQWYTKYGFKTIKENMMLRYPKS